MKTNKKGSAMVEAAIVFPIVILTAMTMFYMVLSLYNEADVQSQLHIALRGESGIQSETWELKSIGKTIYSGNFEQGNEHKNLKKDSANSFQRDSQNEYILNLQWFCYKDGILLEKHLEGEAIAKGQTLGLIKRNSEIKFSQTEWLINEEEYIRWLDAGKKVLLPFLSH